MSINDLIIKLAPDAELGAEERLILLELLERAYEEPLAALMDTFTDPVHLLGSLGGRLVSHLMWVTRWLQPEGLPMLRTAYIEMVTTEPAYQQRGLATRLLQRLPGELLTYDLAALSPATYSLYTRQGWELWRGPLFIRMEHGWQATPDEEVMILRLPRTPANLDLDAPLTAEWRPGEAW